MKKGTIDKKVALITGVTGQDGSYLAEYLLEKRAMRCTGLNAAQVPLTLKRIDHIYQDRHETRADFLLHYGISLMLRI